MRPQFRCAANFDAAGLISRAQAAGDRALARSGEELRSSSAALAPRRSGNLIASARVEIAPGRATVRYGAPYAAIQHERSDLRHPNGGQAGFLRAAAGDFGGTLAEILADELRKEF